MNTPTDEFASCRRAGFSLYSSVVCDSGRRYKLTIGKGFTVALVLLLGLLGCATEEKDWNQACSTNSRDSYQAFLQKHPSTKYSSEASHRIEEFDWSAAQKSDDAQGYETYLRQYPKGTHLTEAQARLDVVRPIEGILGIAFPMGGPFEPGGIFDVRRPIFALSTTEEVVVLRLTPDTAYSGITGERGGAHKWFPGGKYEVTGQQVEAHKDSGSNCSPHGICMLFGTKDGWAAGSGNAWGSIQQSGAAGQVKVLAVTTGPAKTGPKTVRRDLFVRSIRYIGGGEGPMSIPH